MSISDSMTAHYILLLGSNVGDTRSALAAARDSIKNEVGPLLSVSPEVLTSPMGEGLHGDFLNQALLVRSGLEPQELLAVLESIERKMGRDKHGFTDWDRDDRVFEDRVIDIDIAFADFSAGYEFDGRYESESLRIPHKAVRQRGFVRELVSGLEPVPSSGWTETVRRLFFL